MISLCSPSRSFQTLMFCKRLKFPISYLNVRLKHQIAETSNQTCEYPPIIDISDDGQRRHQRQMWYDSIKAMPTVEEKLYELAVQQRLDLEKYIFSCVPPTYSGIFFQKFITRTHLIKCLPEKLMNINVEDELSDIKDNFNEVLHNYYHNPWQNQASKQLSDYLNEKDAGSLLLNQLITQCFKRLASKNEHIAESTIQQKPLINSFWWHGGYESKENETFEKNLAFRYQDSPAFVIRMKKPLSPILDMKDPFCATAEISNYHYRPEVFDFPSKIDVWLSSLPGFWPGDPYEFPFLQVLTSDKLQSLLTKIEKYDLEKIENNLGLMASFGYLNTIANYQGFTPFQDVTYPFVVQTILTNGQDFTFFVYQLNTIAFHEDVDNKDRRNLCWTSGKLRLFETIEDGSIKGINEDVYRLLLKFMLNTPELKEGQVLKPYLGTDIRTEEETKNMRFFLKKMYSQRRAHDAHKNEVPMWVKIYKLHKDAPPSPFIKLE